MCQIADFFLAFLPQNDTLMRYLLNELHAYETDYSNALAPTSWEATASFAGEAVLLRPASTEALNMVHAALTADVTTLYKAMVNISASQDAMLKAQAAMLEVQAAASEEICQKFSDVTNLINNTPVSALGTLVPPQHMDGEST